MNAVNRRCGELQPESFAYACPSVGARGISREWESPFTESEEMELAAELLAANSEAELEQFLGKLFKKAWSGIKSVAPQIGGVLKSVAKVALPVAATAAGTFFGGPAGGMIAGKLGSMVSQALEAETAGLPPENRDFAKCRHFVRMAGLAAKAAAAAPPGVDPVAVVQKTLANAAQRQIAQAGPSLRSESNAGKPAAPTNPTKPSPTGKNAAQQHIAQSGPPTSAGSNAGKQASLSNPTKPSPTGKGAIDSIAPVSFPASALRGGAANPAGKPLLTQPPAPQATGRSSAEFGVPAAGTTPSCGCKGPGKCSCAKCRSGRGDGRWIRQGKSIVIINC